MTEEKVDRSVSSIELAAGVIPLSGKILAGVGMRQEGKFKLLSATAVPSCTFTEKGVPQDFPKFGSALERAIEHAASAAGVQMYSVAVGVNGGEIIGLSSRGAIYVGKDSRPITVQDKRDAIAAARKIELPTDRQVLQALPVAFAVDHKRGLDDPEGMQGMRLECEAHLITASRDACDSFTRAVANTGWKLENMIYDGWASVRASLKPGEGGRNLVVDICDTHTDVVLVDRGKPVFTAILDFGLSTVAEELSREKNISTAKAWELVAENAVVQASDDLLLVQGMEIEIEAEDGYPRTVVSTGEIWNKVEQGIERLLKEIKKKLSSRDLAETVDCVVFSGAASEVDGIVKLGRDIFDTRARRADLGKVDIDVERDKLFRLSGLLQLTIESREASEGNLPEQAKDGSKLSSKVGKWLKDFFT
ncbi:MAG: hypothetical protein U5N86_01610 [Planctomycetota bacterium]|nr:hypothetical protein [Planctomycetota bacterium]